MSGRTDMPAGKNAREVVMSERIGQSKTVGEEADHRRSAYYPCTGSPATLKPGCMVAMADSITELLIANAKMARCRRLYPRESTKDELRASLRGVRDAEDQARAALAMYNGGE